MAIRRQARNLGGAGIVLLAGTAIAAAVVLAFAGSGSAAAKAIPSNTKPPTFSGTEREGNELSADHGDWTGSPTDYDYQWQRCNSSGGGCANISGGDGRTYELGSADVGNRVRVGVDATNGDGTSGWSYSGTSSVIAAAGSGPKNTSPPTISGTPRDNETLTAAAGSWAGTDPITYAYEWRRCDAGGNNCSKITSGSQSYKVTSSDVGRTIRVAVTGKNSVGSSTAVSGPTSVVAAAGTGPKNTSLPAVSGTAQDNQTLTTTAGGWSGTSPISFAYQWYRCDANGNNCATIPGATGVSYKVTSTDVGHRLRVAVTAKNGVGSSTVTSSATAVAVAAGPAGAIKLSNGTTSIPVSSVSLPNQLTVDRVVFTPSSIRSRTEPLTGRFHVVDVNGYVVRDALVYAIGVPANRVAVPAEAQTDQSGWATITYQLLRGLPLKNGALLTIFIRARKPGENILRGVSTRRLVSIRVRR
jgi:hypothetical protein